MTDAPEQPDAPAPEAPAPDTPAPDAPAARNDGTSGGSEASAVFAEGMAAAARRAGFTPAAEGEPISGRALLAAMGGIRGLVEAVIPGLVFLITYTFIRQLIPALIAPVAIGAAFIVARRLVRQTVTPAVGGLVGLIVSAVLALFTGKAEDFYLPGFWTNGAYGAALLISALVGWPLVGLAVGFLMGDGVSWRAHASKRRVLTILTLCWAGLFAVRLAVQLPLYFSGNVEWLGAAKLLMGIPLYAPLLVISWLMVRSVYRAADDDAKK
ncbi:DUF3159 domain-containing protein [Cryobacterium sp. TMT1-21]|uniref:DUF3159 domain-containing protein n=1 Tax=Cryobacterium shii TaxID=1259235 RepID=A0AAQ2C865_9MICO|nr:MULTISPECIES: DUF3159 domain-containing protein [Cryobacterium]TFC51708.1 DUF3159 domain-containing protein [Cryobacterium shii]TFC89424.1 DUF3159 domain-containing protein [Cryobacterium sp. TmT2-59]TFD13675.1 DUF3159 domain-containing protein [Cryobacterium sp. TMT4-10]TFD15962.1 DUF3159 domain-containing protein [Cryobacterium sp. TMT1-21]TFD19810.1 DUF3159 domain-containing protein [Cryobacterium sp. TMT2-23]